MKKSRVVLILTAGLLVVALIILALLPAIVSNDMMKPFVIRKVNQQLPGQLQLESWSISWLSGIDGQGIVYDNRTDGLLVQVSEIKTEKGLLGLIMAGGQLGAVEIVDPAVVFYLSDKIEAQDPQKTPPANGSPESIPSEKKDAFIPVFYGRFKIINGSILTATADGSEKTVAKNLDLILDAPGPQSTITYRFSTESGDSSGRAAGRGSLVLAADDPLNLEKIQSDSKLTVENWELEDLFAIISTRSGIPSAKGRLNANVSLTGSNAESLKIAGQMAIKKLQLRGGPLGSDTPEVKDIVIDLDATGDNNRFSLNNLTFRSSLANGSARGIVDDGNQKRLSGKADVDLAKMFTQFPSTLKLREGTKITNGKMKLNLKLSKKTDNLNHAILKLSIDDFVLIRNRRPILARQTVRADISTDVQMADEVVNSSLLQPTLNIQSSIIRGTVKAERIEGSASNRFPNAAGLNLDGNINLQQLSSLLKNLKILSPQTLLAGQSTIKTSGNLKDGLLGLNNTRVDTQKLVYRQDNKSIRENRVILTTRGQIDLNNQSLLLAPVDIDTQAGKIHIAGLTVFDWTHAQKNMKVKGHADLDLNQLAQGYGDFIQLPKKTKLIGNGRFDFDVDFSNPKQQYLKLQGNVAPFKLVSKTLPTISEKKVTLKADVTRSPDGRNMTINNLELNSNALSLNAAGTLNQVGKNKVLKAKGTMKPDLKLVSDYLKKSGQSPVAFSGKKATPFTIKLVSKGDRWEDPLKHLNFSSAVHVTAIEAYGLKLTPNDVPIRIAGAAAGAKLESPANGGQLNFQPTIDMRKEPYILSFKDNIDLLKDVQVTQGLIDGLLAAIHPLFKDAVVPDGLLGLNMKHFSWPLSEKERNRATFAGTLKLNGIRLNSTPFLAGLLNMMGISERQLSLANQKIDFEAKNGRMALSPMTLDAEGYQLKIHGSIGFDKTLDLIARIPDNKRMVGKDAYRFLRGTTIKVPIRGTAAKPRIDEAVFQEATGDLMQQAFRKNLEKGARDLLKSLFKKSE